MKIKIKSEFQELSKYFSYEKVNLKFTRKAVTEMKSAITQPVDIWCVYIHSYTHTYTHQMYIFTHINIVII